MNSRLQIKGMTPSLSQSWAKFQHYTCLNLGNVVIETNFRGDKKR